MSSTTTPAGLNVQRWRSTFFTEVFNSNKFMPYIGTKRTDIIQVDEELTGKPGSIVTFSLVNQLDTNRVLGNAVLEGSESLMVTRSFNVTVNQERFGIELQHFERKKSAIDQMKASKEILVDKDSRLLRNDIILALGSINGVNYASASEAQKDAWLVDNTDRAQFGAVRSNSSTLDHSASLANIDNTSDKLTAAVIGIMKRLGKTSAPIVRPIGVDGSDMYLLFTPSLLFRDLSLDTTVTQANREARARGLDNPIFKGAGLVVDNIIIVEVEDIEVLTGVGAGGIDVAPCYMCGAQAVALAWGERPHEIFNTRDFMDKEGIGIAQIRAVKKMLFGTGATDTDDLKDYGVVTGFFAAVADA